MLTFPLPAVLNGDALRAQLRAAGLIAAEVSVSGADLVITGTDDRAAAASVVSAHDGQPLPLDPEAQADVDAATQLASIRAKAKQVAAGTDTFTAAQVQKILAHLVLRATR